MRDIFYGRKDAIYRVSRCHVSRFASRMEIMRRDKSRLSTKMEWMTFIAFHYRETR